MNQHFAHRLRSFGWVVLLAAVVPAAVGQALDRSALLEQQRKNRADQYKSMQNAVKGMQALDVKRIEDIFQVRMEEKHLTCVTSIDAAKTARLGQYRVELDGFKGPTYVQISQSTPFQRIGRVGKVAAPAANAKPAQTFTLLSYELPNPDSLTTVSVQAYPNYFHIEKSSQLNDGHWMVRLMEQRNPDLPDGGMVQLWVNQYGGGVQQPMNINIQEADFPTMLREHPHEVDEYIRPLFRQLGQEQVFAPDFRVAWQVLSEYWPADDQAVAKVRELLPELDQVDFRQREKALAAIIGMERAGAAVLLHLDRTGFSPERNLLIDRALAPFAQLPLKESNRLRADKAFLLDCLYSDDATIRKAAFQQLRKVTAREGLAFDSEGKVGDRCEAIRELRQAVLGKPTTKPVN